MNLINSASNCNGIPNMFHRIIDDELSLVLLVPKNAPELYALTNKNSAFLREWLPWVDSMAQSSDTESFIHEQLTLFSKDQALQVSIIYNEAIVGVAGFHEIDQANATGHIGYWLAEQFNGKGLMTRAVDALISVGFDDYVLNRIEIQCATGNIRSRAVPERLGFTQEGIIREAEKVNENYLDLAVYGLLKGEGKSNPLSVKIP